MPLEVALVYDSAILRRATLGDVVSELVAFRNKPKLEHLRGVDRASQGRLRLLRDAA